MPAIVKSTRSDCAAVVFEINTSGNRRAIPRVAIARSALNRACADSESRFLAMKKFSRRPASRLIDARQNRFFTRIAAG
jgi:hypothetical protein